MSSSATDPKGTRRALDRWIVVEAGGFQFAFPLEELDAVIDLHSSRIRRTQGRRRPGFLGSADWAGTEREIRLLAEQLGLQARVMETYPAVVTRTENPNTGEFEPVFWAVERVTGSYDRDLVVPEPVPPEWWTLSPVPFKAVWWQENRPVWILGSAELVARWKSQEAAAGEPVT